MNPDLIDELVVKVRTDTGGFMAGVDDMQRTLEGPFAAGLERAGGRLQRSLGRALVDGRLGFDDLKRIGLSVLADISQQALRMDLGAIFGGGGSGGGGQLFGGLLGGLLGLPGRATGGSVSAGRAYMVGERGPELFVPTAAGRVEAGARAGGAVTVNVNVTAPRDAGPAVMRQTGNQVARAVARALQRAQP